MDKTYHFSDSQLAPTFVRGQQQPTEWWQLCKNRFENIGVVVISGVF